MEPDLFDVPRVRVAIRSNACASELYVVNRGYALVGKGVGTLTLWLEPGRYKVRQRIGYTERVQDFEVPTNEGAVFTIDLPVLRVPSPIPLRETPLIADDNTLPTFSLGASNFRFILRAPLDRHALAYDVLKHMREEMARLRIENFHGERFHLFGAEHTYFLEEQGALVFDIELPTGTYLIVQTQNDARQLCMPVVVLEGWVTSVFCLVLSNEGEPIPVSLGHVSVAVLHQDEISGTATGGYEGSLLRLEAARKALAAGRDICGWLSHQSRNSPPKNPMLALIDAQLYRGSIHRQQSSKLKAPDASEIQPASCREDLTWRLLDLVDLLGENSPDVVALSIGLSEAEARSQIAHLQMPPILKRSWDQLLANPEANAQMGWVMRFPFQVETGSIWFIWSEQPDLRAQSFSQTEVDAVHRDVSLGHPVPSWPTTTGGLSVPIADWLSTLTYRLKALRHIVKRGPLLKLAADSGADVDITLADVETMLTALLENKTFLSWLAGAQQVFEAEGDTIKDDSMRRLISSMRSLADPVLIAAFGPSNVAKQILSVLRLPQDRVIQLVGALLAGIVTHLDGPDREVLRKTLSGVAAAEAWLATFAGVPKNHS